MTLYRSDYTIVNVEENGLLYNRFAASFGLAVTTGLEMELGEPTRFEGLALSDSGTGGAKRRARRSP